KYPFAWLQFRPAKYSHRHHIAFCLLHHGNVFINNIGVILPLLRIIIRAMQQRTNLGCKGANLFIINFLKKTTKN
ncbi:hypothetical protein K16_10490, partial [Klebsiella pneumoniae]